MQAIALARITPRGTERGIRIHRKNGDGRTTAWKPSHDPVQTDDVIFVRESLF